MVFKTRGIWMCLRSRKDLLISSKTGSGWVFCLLRKTGKAGKGFWGWLPLGALPQRMSSDWLSDLSQISFFRPNNI